MNCFSVVFQVLVCLDLNLSDTNTKMAVVLILGITLMMHQKYTVFTSRQDKILITQFLSKSNTEDSLINMYVSSCSSIISVLNLTTESTKIIHNPIWSDLLAKSEFIIDLLIIPMEKYTLLTLKLSFLKKW